MFLAVESGVDCGRWRGAERGEVCGDDASCVFGLDDCIDVSFSRGFDWCTVFIGVLGFKRRQLQRTQRAHVVQNLHGRLGAHHGDLRRGPRVVEIRAEHFGRHDAVRAAVRLAQHHANLGHLRFRVRVQQLRAVPDNAAVLFRRARQKPRHVYKRHDGDVERVAQPHKPRGFGGRVAVEHAREVAWLVRDDSNHVAVHAAKPNHDV
mmetsp:Transcript_6696/g.14316  ORF Transcript_6696/g.14316 Transcript_6696/m.14316 type:complete len:206 (+) Transcript_6696:65-682(+)